MNDLSAHPAASGSSVIPIILNTLGDLTNRENRYASPRFCNDYVTHGTPGTYGPDGVPDDENQGPSGVFNGDSVPDFYPTLYPGVFSPTNAFNALIFDFNGAGTYLTASRYGYSATNYTIMPFPFIFPGMYSKPDPYSVANGLGWIHSVNPATTVPDYGTGAVTTLGKLPNINHAPIDIGDSLPYPATSQAETWWGFPTWRDTPAPSSSLTTPWNDPYTRLNEDGYPDPAIRPDPGQPQRLSHRHKQPVAADRRDPAQHR